MCWDAPRAWLALLVALNGSTQMHLDGSRSQKPVNFTLSVPRVRQRFGVVKGSATI